MSRWWADAVRIGLAPGRVDVAQRSRLPGRGPWRQTGADCAPAAGQPPWQAALEALPALLAEPGQRGAAASVVLSNHWVRYLVLPWSAQLSSPAELQQWARLRLTQTYGVAAADWTVCLSDGGWGRPQVACAADPALVQALAQCLAQAGLRLVSLQPLLMAAYNRARRRLRGRAALAIVETGRVCLGLLEPGGWGEISSRRCGSDAAATVEQELATLASAAEPPPLQVLLVGTQTRWPAADTPTGRLLGPPAGGLSLALCGVA